MRLKLLVPVLAATIVVGSPAYAHHPFAATYLEDKTTQVEGKLVSFVLRNPHSFIQVEAKDDKGQIQRWTIEWAGAAQLETQGVNGNTLKYGDVVTISGNLGRVSEDHEIRLISLLRQRNNFRWGAVQ